MNLGELHPSLTAVREAVGRALQEDLAPLGDITASLMPPGVRAKGQFVTSSDGVLAGSLCAVEVFHQVDPTIRIAWASDDGTEIAAGDVVGTVEGPLASILAAEGTALNFLSHLSGIASLTRRYVRAGQNKVRIRDTRHTTPGIRALEMAAVRAGGGVNRRGSLSDSILLHANYLQGVSISDAVRRAHMRQPGRLVQVECTSREQVKEALSSEVDVILLDGFDPDAVKECVTDIDGKVPVEVGGDIDLRAVGAYVNAGVDMISVSALTRAPTRLDITFNVAPDETGQ